MKELQPANFPLNEEAILQPKTVLYTHKDNRPKNISVINITDHDSNAQSIIDPDAAKTKATGRKPMLELSQDTWYSRTLKATGDSGDVVAEVSGLLLALGLWTLTFPTEFPHSSHPVELRPRILTKLLLHELFDKRDPKPAPAGTCKGAETKFPGKIR
jgi:hypothetical protein